MGKCNKKRKNISIALATFNGELYLRELIDSLYRQTFSPYEVMVCDDGSTDGTIDILEKYSRSHGLIYQVNQCNHGYVKNFEKIISLCRGDYIALCDQDDRWRPDKLKILSDNIGNYSLICSDAALIDRAGKKISGSYRKYKGITIPFRKKQTRSLLFGNYVIGCTSLFRKSDFISPLYPFPDNIPHDWWIAVIFSMKGGIKYIKKQLIDYRLHGNNITGVSRKSLFNDICTYREKLRNNQNHLLTVIMIKYSLLIIEELEKRALADSWMISLKQDLYALLKDLENNLVHPKANSIFLKYLNYFCPSPNPLVKLMFMIENFHK